MKFRLLHLGDAYLLGFILMINSARENQIPLDVRAILIVGALIMGLIVGGVGSIYLKTLGKRIPEADSIMEREYDERAQILNMQARNYASRIMQILLSIFAVSLFIIYNETLISLILLFICLLYDLLSWAIRKILDNK